MRHYCSSSLIFYRVTLTWGTLYDELIQFLIYGLFQEDDVQLPQTKNVQIEFKTWYNRMYPHDFKCSRHNYMFNDDDNDNNYDEEEELIIRNSIDDFRSCRCPNRPYKFDNALWSLQLAIAYTTGQHLDKSHTISQWGLGLDRTLRNNMLFNQNYQLSTKLFVPQKYLSERHRLSKLCYAIRDCFAVAKFVKIMKESNHPERLSLSEQNIFARLLSKEKQRSRKQQSIRRSQVVPLSPISIPMDLSLIQNRLENIHLQLQSIESNDDLKQLQTQQQQYLQHQYQQLRRQQKQ